MLLTILVGCQRELPVLLYHEVGCGTRDVRDVPPEQFDAQLTYLETHGYQLVPLTRLLQDPKSLPAHPVALTFDDGAACIHSSAFPLLRKHRAPFEVFLVSDWVAADAEHRVSQPLENGEQVPSLIWPEVRAMVASGLGTVGGHGRSHLRLTGADGRQLENEVGGSRKALGAMLGLPVDLFAYPFGAFDAAAEDAVRRAGFTGAMSVSNGLGGTFAYRRRSIHRDLSESDFAERLHERWILPLLNHD
jgi:peptidoglycan/xylan/chitin deacetylase (PgdA/CDA1 family)